MTDLRLPNMSRRGMLGAAGVAAASGAGLFAAGTAGAAPNSTDRSGRHCASDPAQPKHEFRASWIATTVNIDWPSQPGLDIDTQKAEYLQLLDDAENFKLNAVVTQIRPTGDAFWPSAFEPWSRWLTGTQGQDPGYDPLAFAVEETHKRGLEFHGWLNPYRISMSAATGDAGGDLSKLHPDHPARQHPEWVVAYPSENGQLYYNPGLPEVREFVINAMMDAVDKYDMDAVHFDDYFYPYPSGTEDFGDDEAYAQYGGDFDNKGDWRRNNTDLLIEEFGRRIKESKPWVRFGVSPFAVWRNIADDPEGSETEAGSPTYDVLYADTRKWVREGWIDYIAPQIYWAMSLEIASYSVVAQWWNDVCEGTDCDLYIGEAVYKVGTSDQSPEWINDPRELSNHVALSRELPNVSGNIYYNASSVHADLLSAMTLVRDDHYLSPALPSVHEHLGRQRPSAPQVRDVSWKDGTYTVKWRGSSRKHGLNATASYAIYSVADGKFGRCDFTDATNLVAVVSGNDTSFTWKGDRQTRRRFAVTAINRIGRESEPGKSGRPRC